RDALPAPVGHRAHLELVDAEVRVVPLVPHGDRPEDPMLLEPAEVRIDRLNDVKRPVALDRDVGRETLHDPALVSQGGRGERQREQDDPDRDREGARRATYRNFRSMVARPRNERKLLQSVTVVRMMAE